MPVKVIPAVVPDASNLQELGRALQNCSACGHCQGATRPVFGEGSEGARIVLVGEQPGDEEDKARRPFVGPAGRLLDKALQDAGIDRDDVYVTNAVKTFLYVERGKRRIHQKPKGEDVVACRPWLTAEISLVRPKVVVCLGATAARSVFGRVVAINASRGQLLENPLAQSAVVTFHPSAVLRAIDESARQEMREALVADLKLARSAA